MEPKTIYDLPYDILKIILRMVIVGPNTGAYFCVNKFFNNTLNGMAKKYTLDDKFCCVICYDYNFRRSIKFKNTSTIKPFKKQIIFDNICNVCYVNAFPHSCIQCNVKFMSTYTGKNVLCIGCYEKDEMKDLVVLHNLQLNNRHISFKCNKCRCDLFASYYQFVTPKTKTICYNCLNNISKKLIVSPHGFPYVINTICPTL